MHRSHDAVAVRSGSLQLGGAAAAAPSAGSLDRQRQSGEFQQRAAHGAPLEGPAGPADPKRSQQGRELRLVIDQLTAARGDRSAPSTPRSDVLGALADAATGPRAARVPGLSDKSIDVLRAAVEAFEAASGPLAPGDGVSAASGTSPTRQARVAPAANSRPAAVAEHSASHFTQFTHLPWWRRHYAWAEHHWRVFKQAVNEDPEYADAVAHRWNKWLAIAQFVVYNGAVVLIFAIAAASQRFWRHG